MMASSFAGPTSWFHVEKNQSFSLLFLAIFVLGALDIANAANYGKVWADIGRC